MDMKIVNAKITVYDDNSGKNPKPSIDISTESIERTLGLVYVAHMVQNGLPITSKNQEDFAELIAETLQEYYRVTEEKLNNT